MAAPGGTHIESMLLEQLLVSIAMPHGERAEDLRKKGGRIQSLSQS